MAIKKIISIVLLVLFIVAVLFIAYENFHTTKQVYEGILVYGEEMKDLEQELVCYHV